MGEGTSLGSVRWCARKGEISWQGHGGGDDIPSLEKKSGFSGNLGVEGGGVRRPFVKCHRGT